jgi:ribosomal protein S27AE
MAVRQHVRDLERLASLEPGGAPDRPIEVDAPPLVDVMAEQRACPLCQGSLHLLEHAAETIEGERLRVARVKCGACGSAREIYFRLSVPLVN